MSVNHGGLHIIVSEQFLHNSDVVTGSWCVANECRKERQPTYLTTPALRTTSFSSPLKNGLMDVVAAFLTGLRIPPTVLLWKQPLPTPFSGGAEVFAVEGAVHLDAAPALGEVLLVDELENLLEVFPKWRRKRLGQHRDAILAVLAGTARESRTMQHRYFILDVITLALLVHR